MNSAVSSHTPQSRLLGTGHYVPEKSVRNADLEGVVETTDAWITSRTGIKERRKAADGQAASDLALAAAKKALDAAGLLAADLDLIIVGTITADQPVPSCAALLQQKLGADAVPAFDIAAACAGFVFGLTIADRFIANKQARCVLVVGVELLSRKMNWNDRTTCVLFGDGAGAAIVGPASFYADGDEPSEKPAGLLATQLHTDGGLANALSIPGGGCAEPPSREVVAERRDKVHMNGKEVFKTAVRNLTATSTQCLRASGLTSNELDWVVAHQANIRILQQVSTRLGFPMDKFIVNIHKYGNTSSASIPIALDEAIRDGRIQPGQTVLMCALGAGISWGSVLLRL